MSALTRLLGATVAAALLTVLVLASIGYWQYRHVSDSLAADSLRHGSAVQGLLEQHQRDSLVSRVELLAGNQAFVGYVSQALDSSPLPGMGADIASLSDILLERRDQLALDMLGLVDLRGRVIAATDTGLLRRRELAGDATVRTAIDTLQPSTGLMREGDRVVLVAVKPLLRGGTVEGFLLAGMRIDDVFFRELAAASGVDAVLLASGSGTVELAGSSLDPGREDSLRAMLLEQGSQLESAMARAGDPTRIDIAGNQVALQFVPPFGSETQGLSLALISATQASLPGRAVMLPLVLAIGFLLALLLAASLLVWHRLQRPLLALPSLLEAAAAGDLHLSMPVTGGMQARRVAIAFNQLMHAMQKRTPP